MANNSELEEEFAKYVKNYDYSRYSPFYHGTSKDRANNILAHGLKTRNDARKKPLLSQIAEQNIWGSSLLGSESAKSKDDLVYFTTCMEHMKLPLKACEKAYEMEGGAYWEKYKNSTEFQKNECGILRLKNPQKYFPHFVLDEDNQSAINTCKRFFSDKPHERYDVIECLSVASKMDDKLIQFYERAYLEGGEALAHELINKTPEALFSIADWGTIAINRSIDPEDLELVDTEKYMKEEDCRDTNRNKRFNFSKEPEPEDIKAYGNFIHNHTPEGIAQFKAFLKQRYHKKDGK